MRVGEDEADALVAVGHDDQDQQTIAAPEHVPPHRDVVEDARAGGSEDVHQRGHAARIDDEDRKTRVQRVAVGARARCSVLRVRLMNVAQP